MLGVFPPPSFLLIPRGCREIWTTTLSAQDFLAERTLRPHGVYASSRASGVKAFPGLIGLQYTALTSLCVCALWREDSPSNSEVLAAITRHESHPASKLRCKLRDRGPTIVANIITKYFPSVPKLLPKSFCFRFLRCKNRKAFQPEFVRNKEKGGFKKGVFAQMYASLGRDAVSAKCASGPNTLGCFLCSWAWPWTLQKPPLLKPPFLVPEFGAYWGFGARFEIALEPSELQKEGENPGKGHFYFLRQIRGMHQTLVRKRSETSTLLRQILIIPEAQVARNYGTEIIEIPCKNYGAQKNPRQFLRCNLYVTAPNSNVLKKGAVSNSVGADGNSPRIFPCD